MGRFGPGSASGGKGRVSCSVWPERSDHDENRARLVQRVPGPGRDSLAYGDSLAYEEVSPTALKRCPDSFFGASWESWLLSIEGGDVVVVETLFQVSMS